jgi:DNA polymerase III delta prime subunit
VKGIIGHIKQREALAELARTERLPSTLLFSGVSGIGKQLVAREIAAQLLCSNLGAAPLGGCGRCQSCTLLTLGNQPDLHLLNFSSEEGISVDDLRRTLEKLSLRSFMGGRKVAVLNDVDAISVVGANIILKSLEEPRPETFFILTASTPSRLPQTLLSRCQRWFFDRLSTTEIQEILTAQGEDRVDDTIAILADGSISTLTAMRGRTDLWDDVRQTVDQAHAGDSSAVARAALSWGTEKNLVQERLTFMRSAIRAKLLQHADNYDAAAVWSNALQNALDAEHLVQDRHVNPTLCFAHVLSSCNKQLTLQYQRRPNSMASLGERLLRG